MTRPVSSRALALVLLLCGCLLLVSACSGLQGTDEAKPVVEIAPADRGEVRELAGETLQGDPIALSDFRGEVVVVNLWASWCGPCIREVPLLQGFHESVAGQDVVVLGIDVREASLQNGLNFEKQYGVTYPSIYDQGGRLLLELRGEVPTKQPSTLVFDREGRIAARILGEIPSETTLRTIVEKVQDETADE